jgi:hypothetical protein
MASIGPVGCTFVRGNPPATKMRLQLWRVPGLDGYGAQALGYNDSPFEVLAVLYSDAVGVESWKVALEGLQGSIVTIINDLGASFGGCLITKLSNMKNMAAYAAGGITARAEITIEGVVLP